MKFVKHRQYYLIFSVYCLITLCAIYFSSFTKLIAGWILQVDLAIDQTLSAVLNSSDLGIHLRHILSLALTPILIVALPTAIYWFFKKKMPAYLIQTIWVLWIIVAMSRLLS